MTNNKNKKSFLGNLLSKIENFFTSEIIERVKGIIKESDAIGKGIILLTPVFSFIIIYMIPWFFQHPNAVQGILAFGNLVMLLIWIFYWGKQTYELELIDNTESYALYCEYLKLNLKGESYKKTIGHNEDRVNKLVHQLKLCITGYAITLVVVYFLFLFETGIRYYSQEIYDSAHHWFKIPQDIFNFLSAMFLYLGFTVFYDKTLNEKNNPKYEYARYALGMSIGFLVIYFACTAFITKSRPENTLPRTTIDTIYNASANYKNTAAKRAQNDIKDIKKIINNYPDSNVNSNPNVNANTNINAATKANANVNTNINANVNANANANVNVNGAIDSIEQITNIANTYQKEINKQAKDDVIGVIAVYEQDFETILPNVLGLLIGCANALTMFLLFGRYISMEHLINNTKEGKSYSFITIGTIYLLPIYALVQPLFGSFEINAFGNPIAFANYVFFICLCGKIFFLYFTWRYMKKRLMHYYLHSVVTYHGISPNLQSCFQGNYPTTDKKKVLGQENEESTANNTEK